MLAVPWSGLRWLVLVSPGPLSAKLRAKCESNISIPLSGFHSSVSSSSSVYGSLHLPVDRPTPAALLSTKLGAEEILALKQLQLRLAMVVPRPPSEADAADNALLQIV